MALAKDLGKYKALDKFRISVASMVLSYRQARKFPECPRSLALEELGKCFDALTSACDTIDSTQ